MRIRPIELRGEAMLSFVYRHATRDVTKNLAPAAGRAAVVALLDLQTEPSFAHATLHAGDAELQLRFSKKGKQALVRTERPVGDTDRSGQRRPTTAPSRGRCRSTCRSGSTSASPTSAIAWCRRWRASGSRSTSSSRSWSTRSTTPA